MKKPHIFIVIWLFLTITTTLQSAGAVFIIPAFMGAAANNAFIGYVIFIFGYLIMLDWFGSFTYVYYRELSKLEVFDKYK